jgi:hypothetical protein
LRVETGDDAADGLEPRSGTEHSSPHGGIPRRIISSPEGKIAMVVIQKLNNETIQGSQGTRVLDRELYGAIESSFYAASFV